MPLNNPERQEPPKPIRPEDLEFVAGHLVHRCTIGFSESPTRPYATIDRARDGLRPIAEAMGLDIGDDYIGRTGAVVAFSRKHDARSRMFGIEPPTVEYEIELWMQVYHSLRSDVYKDRVRKWLGKHHIEPPEEPGPQAPYRRNRRR